MKKAKLSIVTISYNQSEFIKECIESVLSQIDANDEYIVVDPGSTDGSREIIGSYKDIITVFEKDSGPADGLNNGFNKATGEYYYFLNSDDILLPGAIDNIKAAIQAEPLKDVFCFQGYLVNKNLTRLRLMRTFNFSAKMFCRGATSLFQQGLVFSAKYFHQVGGFDKNNRTCWDARLLFDLSMAGARIIDKPSKIALFRIYDGSITGSAENLVENQRNKDEMFYQALGRKRNVFDVFLYNILRFKKYFYFNYTFETIKLHLKNQGKKSA